MNTREKSVRLGLLVALAGWLTMCVEEMSDSGPQPNAMTGSGGTTTTLGTGGFVTVQPTSTVVIGNPAPGNMP